MHDEILKQKTQGKPSFWGSCKELKTPGIAFEILIGSMGGLSGYVVGDVIPCPESSSVGCSSFYSAIGTGVGAVSAVAVVSAIWIFVACANSKKHERRVHPETGPTPPSSSSSPGSSYLFPPSSSSSATPNGIPLSGIAESPRPEKEGPQTVLQALS